jgi:hypothetical protein
LQNIRNYKSENEENSTPLLSSKRQHSPLEEEERERFLLEKVTKVLS